MAIASAPVITARWYVRDRGSHPFAECKHAAEQRLTQPVQGGVQWHQRLGHRFYWTGVDVGPVFLASWLVEGKEGAEAAGGGVAAAGRDGPCS